ncbi:hypothetical protein D088_940107 [Salmonella enterica subsp. houtenae serovar 16:z4,z32:-- str. RKS3027]|nr:hypothetical protein D088_940107 [Salmonella enterica subsp. houtenae serovar 16:z4,z32:-- str. RKS3027]
MAECESWVKYRFIPAGAGNSLTNQTPSSRIAVYPRWRGELALAAVIALFNSGLSPLARGTQKSRKRLATCDRFIPAGAGNSDAVANGIWRRTVYPRWRGELTKF